MEKTKEGVTLKCAEDADAQAAYQTLVDPAAKEEQWVEACSVLESKGMLAEILAVKAENKPEEQAPRVLSPRKRPDFAPIFRRTALALLLLLAVERGCYHLGTALHKQHVNQVANKLLAVSCHINPLDASAHAERALVLNELDMTPLAIKEANEALWLDKRNFDARIALGQVAAATWSNDAELLERAKAEMNSAARMQPDNGYAWFLLAVLEENSMDREHAAIYYQRAIDLGYTKSNIFERIARVTRDYRAAADWYSAAIALNAADPLLLSSRAFCYERLGDYRLAAADYEKASRIAGEDLHFAAGFLGNASKCYFELADYAHAYTAADMAMNYGGIDAGEYLHQRAIASLRMNRLQDAYHDFEQCGLIGRGPGYHQYYMTTDDRLMAAECAARLSNEVEMNQVLEEARLYGATEHDIETVQGAFGKKEFTAKYDDLPN